MKPSQLKQKTCIGLIGLGAMGLPIAKNLISANYTLKVYTRSNLLDKSKELRGSIPCSSPLETAIDCEALILCVSDEYAVEEVLFGGNSASKSLKKGQIIIDLSTISPSKAKMFAAKLAKRNITYFDAPVTGGTEGAKNGSLTIFLGANEEQLKKISNILNVIGSQVYTFGEVGKGQEVKAINQILVAGTYIAVAEAIALGQRLQLPMRKVVKALTEGAAGSWALKNRSEAMLLDKYPLGFKLGLHHKDLEIAMEIAADMGLSLPITSKVKEIEEKLIKKGYNDNDISVLRRSINI